MKRPPTSLSNNGKPIVIKTSFSPPIIPVPPPAQYVPNLALAVAEGNEKGEEPRINLQVKGPCDMLWFSRYALALALALAAVSFVMYFVLTLTCGGLACACQAIWPLFCMLLGHRSAPMMHSLHSTPNVL